jgi:hypothetical protein
LDFEANKPTYEENKIGSDKPVPINKDPATSSGILFRLQKKNIAGKQYFSVITVRPQNVDIIQRRRRMKPLQNENKIKIK